MGVFTTYLFPNCNDFSVGFSLFLVHRQERDGHRLGCVGLHLVRIMSGDRLMGGGGLNINQNEYHNRNVVKKFQKIKQYLPIFCL